MTTNSSINTTSSDLQNPVDSPELPDVKPDIAKLGKNKRRFSKTAVYELCALCNVSVLNKKQHVWQHLAKDKEYRFRCSVDDCSYGANSRPKIRDHVCTNHRGGPWKDHTENLQQAFEAVFTNCFGEAVKTPPVKETAAPVKSIIKTRGKTLVVPIPTVNHESVAEPAQMQIVKTEPIDTYAPNYQWKQHVLHLNPRTGRNCITICNLCEKDVMMGSAINHIYVHMAREQQIYRFVCKMGGCNFGSAYRMGVMRHLSRDHERPAKKLVEDRSGTLVNEVNACGREWLGIEEVIKDSVKRGKKRRPERDRNENNNVHWREKDGTWLPVVNPNGENVDDGNEGDMMNSFSDSERITDYDLDQTYDSLHSPDVRDRLLFPISPKWAMNVMANIECKQRLPPKTVGSIMVAVKRQLDSLPNMVEIQLADDQELTICGALNGRFSDLKKIFDLRGLPSEKNLYLFNGDYIDWNRSIDVVMMIFIFKLVYPDYVYINRGNRDSLELANNYGYHNFFAKHYKIEFYTLMNECFNSLPLCHLVNGKIFVVHGGIPSGDGVTLEEIQKVDRKCEPDLGGGIMCDLLWSDAMDEPGRHQSDRGGATWTFGPDVTRDWCRFNGIEYIVRSNGFKDSDSLDPWWVQAGNRCHSIFSSTNSSNRQEKGAIGIIRGTSIILETKMIDADPHEENEEESEEEDYEDAVEQVEEEVEEEEDEEEFDVVD